MKKVINKEKNNNKNIKKTNKKNNNKSKDNKKQLDSRLKEKLLNRRNQKIIYGIIVIIDILIIIYSARNNFANYATIKDEGKVFIGSTKNLLFGRNYITLIITLFFSIYILLCNKLLFNRKNTKKSIIKTLIFLLILNVVLFYIFTKRIY